MSVNASATAKAKNAIKPFGPEISFIIKCSRVPDSAKSNDLREFFSGITIPFGGLVILGGAEGDAFVGFTNDESARMAMERDGNTLHGSKVSLRLSSRNEMEQLLTKRFAEIAIFSQILPTAAKKSDDDEAKRSAPPVAPIAPTPQAQPAPYKPEGRLKP